jgi:hypothetical protein
MKVRPDLDGVDMFRVGGKAAEALALVRATVRRKRKEANRARYLRRYARHAAE